MRRDAADNASFAQPLGGDADAAKGRLADDSGVR
jgi:hypothetical protein